MSGHARNQEKERERKRKFSKPRNVYALNNMLYEWLLLKIHFDLNFAQCICAYCVVNKRISMNLCSLPFLSPLPLVSEKFSLTFYARCFQLKPDVWELNIAFRI